MEIIAHSWTHGTGKTYAMLGTVTDQMIKNPGKRVDMLTGFARSCPLPINLDSTGMSQLWIFASMIKSMLGSKADILVCDRTIYDVIAYTVVGAKDYALADWMLESVKHGLIKYDKIYFHLGEKHNYCKDDGLRCLDVDFRERIDKWLVRFYKESGIEIVEYGRKDDL